jgi:hypothetical protein
MGLLDDDSFQPVGPFGSKEEARAYLATLPLSKNYSTDKNQQAETTPNAPVEEKPKRSRKKRIVAHK